MTAALLLAYKPTRTSLEQAYSSLKAPDREGKVRGPAIVSGWLTPPGLPNCYSLCTKCFLKKHYPIIFRQYLHLALVCSPKVKMCPHDRHGIFFYVAVLSPLHPPPAASESFRLSEVDWICRVWHCIKLSDATMPAWLKKLSHIANLFWLCSNAYTVRFVVVQKILLLRFIAGAGGSLNERIDESN